MGASSLRAAVPLDRPVLTLADLEGYDPEAPAGRTERRFCCPLPACQGKPRDQGHRTLSLNVATGEWYCHRCATGGQLREHWQPALPRQDAKRAAFQAELARTFGPPPVAVAPPTQSAAWRTHLASARPLTDSPGAVYLAATRGLSVDLAVAAGVQYSPDWFGRPAVLFPVLDRAGELVAMHGRHTDKRFPKAHTAGDLKCGAFITPGAMHSDPLVIVEGPCDALALAMCGMAAIALLGVSWPAWLPTVAAFRTVYVGLDADVAGDNAAAKVTAALSFGSTVERLRPLGGKDWNDELLAQGAEDLQHYLFNRYSGPRWTAALKRTAALYGRGRQPHAALEAAIDADDLAAFTRELMVYEAHWLAAGKLPESTSLNLHGGVQ